jgi:dienelactone hydrolase
MPRILHALLLLVMALDGIARGQTTPSTQPSPPYRNHANLMMYIDAAGAEHPVATPADWAIRRAHILAGMQEVMGPMPPDSRRVPLEVKTLEVCQTDRFTRRKITFATEPDTRVPAYLFIPKGAKGKVPAILCPHPTAESGKGRTAGLDGPESRHYALELAQRGYVTIAPDYVGYGEYQWNPYTHGYISATMKGIWDHMRAVDLLVSLNEVDRDRIGVIGHSLGGHNSMFVAVFDPRIKVIVSSCGFNAFRYYKGGDLTGWSHKGYMPKIPSYCGWQNMPFDFHEVVAALAPRPFFVNAPLRDANFDVRGVDEAVGAARRVYRLLGAADGITAVHPDCQHDFPDDVRRQVYAWLDRHLHFRQQP